MADGSFPTLVSKDTSSNAVSNPIWVELTDGSAAVNITSNALDVNVTNATLTIAEPVSVDDNGGSLTVDGTVAATQSGTWNIATVTTLTGITNDVNIADGGNSITVDGTVAATQSGTWVLGANSGVDIGDVDVTSVVPGTGATNLGKAEDAAHTSGDVGVMALAVRNDAGTVLAGTTLDYIPLTTDATGALRTVTAITINAEAVDDSAFTVATDYVSAMGALADETAPDSVDEGDVGIPRMTLDRKLLTRIVGATDANRLDIDASGHAQVDLAAVSVTAVPVSATAAANSVANPIYVQNVTTGVSATEVHDYGTTTDTGNNDYTVTGTTFLLRSVIFGSSGGMKAEIQTGPIASLATKAVGFIAHKGGTEQLFFDPPIEVPVTSTGTVRVVMTNREGSAMSVYSTIIGNDIP